MLTALTHVPDSYVARAVVDRYNCRSKHGFAIIEQYLRSQVRSHCSSNWEAMTSSPCLLSPPLSPVSLPDDDIPTLPTDDWGMILDGDQDGNVEGSGPGEVRAVKEKQRRPHRERQPITYVSRHFSQDQEDGEARPRKSTLRARKGKKKDVAKAESLATPPATPAKSKREPRVYYGLDVDDLSSDSSLTDVPDDIGPDPFTNSVDLIAVKQKQKGKSKSKHPTKSPYFPSGQHVHKPRAHFLSTLPFPPLSAQRFGLMQERLAHDPFRLLIATIFLNKTRGEQAMPVFYKLMEEYPGPEALACGEVPDITAIIQKLGFQNQRARKIVALSKAWVASPPCKGKRYGKKDYPRKGDGRGVKEGEVLNEDDERVGWEISHLPGIGAYAHDSWRMFCRDILLGRAEGWIGEAADEGFEPEWKRVLPLDKELRAWMTWMWLKEGWVWNKETGEQERASVDLMAMARGGGVVIEEKEKDTLTVQKMEEEKVVEKEKRGKVEVPAGEFLDEIDPGVG